MNTYVKEDENETKEEDENETKEKDEILILHQIKQEMDIWLNKIGISLFVSY